MSASRAREIFIDYLNDEAKKDPVNIELYQGIIKAIKTHTKFTIPHLLEQQLRASQAEYKSEQNAKNKRRLEILNKNIKHWLLKLADFVKDAEEEKSKTKKSEHKSDENKAPTLKRYTSTLTHISPKKRSQSAEKEQANTFFQNKIDRDQAKYETIRNEFFKISRLTNQVSIEEKEKISVGFNELFQAFENALKFLVLNQNSATNTAKTKNKAKCKKLWEELQLFCEYFPDLCMPSIEQRYAAILKKNYELEPYVPYIKLLPLLDVRKMESTQIVAIKSIQQTLEINSKLRDYLNTLIDMCKTALNVDDKKSSLNRS